MKSHILETLKKYSKKSVSFHTPGHKNARFYKKFNVDITELSFSDNLSEPTGIIKKAEEDISSVLGVEKSFILTDGSSSGIFSLLYLAKTRGNKIIIQKNSHISVYNALTFLEIEPIFLEQEIKEGLIEPPTNESLKKALEETDAVGFLLTSPDYYGKTVNLEYAKKLTKEKNKLLLVDNAHGAHIKFTDKNNYAGNFADAFVDGAHKTLPALTQGAILNLNNKELEKDLVKAVKSFRTTSPSYPIMASIESAVKYMADSKERLTKLKTLVFEFKNSLKKLGFDFLETDDFFKIVIDCRSVCSPEKIAKYLETKNIFVEMTDGRYILLIVSIFSKKSHFNRLKKALKTLKTEKEEVVERVNYPLLEREISFLTAKNSKFEEISLKDAEGRVLADNLGVFPPCFPIGIAGEKITKELIDLLTEKYFGVEDGKIKVVK
ncbi:MAG: aminotransferase class I/II-fold pyridoxal phosphate-dependent enzyme [Clostridiales bacterium]|nr:aminotransferase class I/II-fold pyridoxal phosphate-dependent enzyme [Clostridiales bacterium]